MKGIDYRENICFFFNLYGVLLKLCNILKWGVGMKFLVFKILVRCESV